jgi:hypothetical protein
MLVPIRRVVTPGSVIFPKKKGRPMPTLPRVGWKISPCIAVATVSLLDPQALGLWPWTRTGGTAGPRFMRDDEGRRRPGAGIKTGVLAPLAPLPPQAKERTRRLKRHSAGPLALVGLRKEGAALGQRR